jgi:enoyl-CoA hydratase
MYASYKHLTFDRDGAIVTVTLNSPPVNAVTCEMHTELARVFVDIQRDTSCHVVILAAAGRLFSAGGDLEDMQANLSDRERLLAELREAPQIMQAILALDKPTIAKVNGHAIGLGASLALLCDIVFAAETAKIADPHVLVGLAAGDGGSLIWPRLIGYPLARHYLFTGEAVTGADAARIGLIYKALPSDELDDAVQVYARKLAAKPYLALSGTKRAINIALCNQAQAEAEAHVGLELATMLSPDHEEAVLSMVEKREPRFTHGRGGQG